MDYYIKPLKIKYGEITRRLNVRVSKQNQKPDIDIKRLRKKIFEFFNFASNADITLTYIDGDGDTLSLVNSDDVFDVIWPDKCLQIYVHLTTEKNTQFHDRTATSSYPISEVLKQPSLELSSQSLLEVASKAAVATSVLAELSRCFIRLANTHLNSDLQSSVSEKGTQKVPDI